jgi:hypothetical protein
LAWPSNMSFSATKPGTRCYLLTEPIIWPPLTTKGRCRKIQ